jgi:hypothetical protein
VAQGCFVHSRPLIPGVANRRNGSRRGLGAAVVSSQSVSHNQQTSRRVHGNPEVRQILLSASVAQPLHNCDIPWGMCRGQKHAQHQFSAMAGISGAKLSEAGI